VPGRNEKTKKAIKTKDEENSLYGQGGEEQ